MFLVLLERYVSPVAPGIPLVLSLVSTKLPDVELSSLFLLQMVTILLGIYNSTHESMQSQSLIIFYTLNSVVIFCDILSDIDAEMPKIDRHNNTRNQEGGSSQEQTSADP